jgi:hypothetical protein
MKGFKMSNTPISNSPVTGYKVDTVFDKEGFVVAPSTLANQTAEDNKGHNPDFFESNGQTMEEQNAVGKGANPSADVVTKNDTTIDPVRDEPSPTADGNTVPFEVPASLPANAPITESTTKVRRKKSDGTSVTPPETT